MQECREVLFRFGLKLEASRSSFILMVGDAKLYILCLHNFVGFGDPFDQPFVIRGWHGMSVNGDKFMDLK